MSHCLQTCAAWIKGLWPSPLSVLCFPVCSTCSKTGLTLTHIDKPHLQLLIPFPNSPDLSLSIPHPPLFFFFLQTHTSSCHFMLFAVHFSADDKGLTTCSVAPTHTPSPALALTAERARVRVHGEYKRPHHLQLKLMFVVQSYSFPIFFPKMCIYMPCMF